MILFLFHTLEENIALEFQLGVLYC